MKTLRIAFLLAIGAVLVAVAMDYFRARESQSAAARVEPEVIPSNLDAQARTWRWSQYTSDQRRVELEAGSFQQVSGSSAVDLRDVELDIYDREGETFDRILCESAQFDAATSAMYSERQVTVLIGIPADEEKRRDATPTVIRSSGVTFDSTSATASTDRYTEYEFPGGSGHSQGAFYHSGHGLFHMKSQAYLERRPTSQGAPKVIIRGGELTYHEHEQRVDMLQGAELERGSQRLRAEKAYVRLNEGFIRQIEAHGATGEDLHKGRRVRFRTPRMETYYTADGTIEKVIGLGPSELVSEDSHSIMRTQGERVEMFYETPPEAQEADLKQAYLEGGARIEISARAREGAAPEGKRRLMSERINLVMRPGGKEVEQLETLSAGRLELLPGSPQQGRRDLEAERIRAAFDEQSRMREVTANGSVRLWSHPPASTGEAAAALRSWSDALVANLDPATGGLSELRQWSNFRFEQGERSGSAGEAVFTPESSQSVLSDRAEVADPHGVVRAHRIVLDQQNDRLDARTQATATYRSAAEAGGDRSPGAGLFSGQEPLFATAERILSDDRESLVRLEGNARLWQKENRVEAQTIVIDRKQRSLTASTGVLSIVTEQTPQAAGDEGRPVVIRAESLRYDDGSGRAHYRDNVDLRRAGLEVRSSELTAHMAPSPDGGENSGKQLQEAVATGEVKITELNEGKGAARQGFGSWAVYRPGEETVVLRGEPARLLDPARGETRGVELTYRTNDDSLLVSGEESRPAYTYRRKGKP